MKKVQVENLKEGDVLSKDILSAKGPVALKEGTVLNKKFIEKIKDLLSRSSGLEDSYIFIEGDREVSKENIKKDLSALEKRFEGTENDDFMNNIKEIIKSVILKDLDGSETL